MTCRNHASFRLLTVARRGSCGPTRELTCSAPSCWSRAPSPKCGRSFRRHLLDPRIAYFGSLENKTNSWMRRKINFLVGPQELLPAIVKRRKLQWLGHVTHHDSLSKTILWTVGGAAVSRRNAGWTTSNSGGSLLMPELLVIRASAEKARRRLLLSHPSCSPDDSARRATELNSDIARTIVYAV